MPSTDRWSLTSSAYIITFPFERTICEPRFSNVVFPQCLLYLVLAKQCNYRLYAEVISVDSTARSPKKLFPLFKISSLINILCFVTILKLYRDGQYDGIFGYHSIKLQNLVYCLFRNLEIYLRSTTKNLTLQFDKETCMNENIKIGT